MPMNSNLIKGYAFILILIGLSFANCKPEVKPTSDEQKRVDSLSAKLNLPELKTLNAEIVKSPSDAALYNKRARIYISIKQFDLAEGDVKRALNIDSSKAEYYITKVDLAYANNKTREAKDILESTIKKFPENVEALLKMAELYYIVKQHQTAIDYINKALKIDENMARAYHLKGTVYAESGDTAKAISSLITATEQDNKYFEAFYDIGVLYAAAKNPLALQYYDNALRIRLNEPRVLYAKAKFFQNAKKIDEAMRIYDIILQVDKTDAQVYYNLGFIYLYEKKDNNKAIEYFSKAIEYNGSFTAAYYARGYTYAQLKDKDNAKADYNMCLQLTPNYEGAIQGLNELGK
jgi:tetratricopeptide (TPR) repeat protein